MRYQTKTMFGFLSLVACASLSCALFVGCEEAVSCVDGSECAVGESCTDGVCESTGAAYVSAPLGAAPVAADGSGVLTVNIPNDAESFAVVFQGAGSHLILAQTITDPSEKVVFDWKTDVLTNRTDATDGVYTVLVPNNPDVSMEGGTWSFTMLTGGDPFEANATAIIKRETSADKLDINLFFVGLGELNAATAPIDVDFQAVLSDVGAVFGGANASIGAVNYIDITGTNADTFATIDSTDSPSGELYQLFALSSGQTNRALNFFFVADIAGADGYTSLGMAGGVPGPPGLHGTIESGVAINMADFLAARAGGDAAAIADANQVTALIMAHEGAHYLGLYHTTERNGKALDANGITGADHLGDTAVCPDDVDDGDLRLSAAECAGHDAGNLMFWSPPNDARTLTSGQKFVVHVNPLVR